jgi:predicted phage tail protein
VKRQLLSVCICILSVACGSTLPTAPARTHDDQSFAVTLGATVTSSAVDLARCLAGSAEASCFSGAVIRRKDTAAPTATAPPTNLVASASGSSVTLTWVPPLYTIVAAYIVEAGSSPGLANLARFSTGNTQTSFSATGIPAGVYYVRVRTIGYAGDISTPSNEAILVVGSGPPCAGAPGPPSGLTLVSVSGGTVVLAWNAAAGSPASYIVEAGSSPGQANLANSDLGLTTSLTATGVGAGTYYVRIRAKNGCGLSGPSNEITLLVGS